MIPGAFTGHALQKDATAPRQRRAHRPQGVPGESRSPAHSPDTPCSVCSAFCAAGGAWGGPFSAGPPSLRRSFPRSSRSSSRAAPRPPARRVKSRHRRRLFGSQEHSSCSSAQASPRPLWLAAYSFVAPTAPPAGPHRGPLPGGSIPAPSRPIWLAVALPPLLSAAGTGVLRRSCSVVPLAVRPGLRLAGTVLRSSGRGGTVRATPA